jgi:hypothetical protein
MRQKTETRSRTHPILVYVTEAERTDIKAKAAKVGMTVSAFMRAVAAGHVMRNMLDLDAITELARLNREQTRLAARLAGAPEGQDVLAQIRTVQAELVKAAQRVRT